MNWLSKVLRSLADLGITVDADQKVTVEGAVAILEALSVIASGVPVTITRDYAPDGAYIGLYVGRHSDSPADGDGIRIQLTVENDNGGNVHLGNITAILEDVSSGAEVGRLAFLVGTGLTVGGMLELLALNTDGTLDIFGDLDMNGNILSRRRLPVTEIDDGDSPYTVLATDEVIVCDTTSGAITVDLLAISGIAGLPLYIKNKAGGANNVTADGNGGETIDAELTQVFGPGTCLFIVPDSTEWVIL